MLIDLCQKYIEIINKGRVPNLQNAWVYLCEQQNERALKLAMQEVEQQFKGLLHEQIIADEDQVKEIKQAIKRKSISVFYQKCLRDDKTIMDQYKHQIDEKIKEYINTFKTKNKTNLEEFLDRLTKTEIALIYDKLNASHYSSRDQFDADLDQLTLYLNRELKQVMHSQDQRDIFIDSHLKKIKLIFNEQYTKKLEQENQMQVNSLQQQMIQLQHHLEIKKDQYDHKMFKLVDLEKDNLLLNQQNHNLIQRLQDKDNQLLQESNKSKQQIEQLIQKCS